MVKVHKVELIEGLEKIEEELQQIIESHKNEIENLKQDIATAKTNEEQAKQAVLEAKKGNDPKLYADKVAEQRTASDVLEYYSGRLEELQNEPLVTEDEYNYYTNRIKSKLEQLNNKGYEKAREILRELTVIEPELTINFNKGNELLSTLQHKLYKDDASMETATGNRIHVDRLENRYRDYELSNSINYIIDSHAGKSIFK